MSSMQPYKSTGSPKVRAVYVHGCYWIKAAAWVLLFLAILAPGNPPFAQGPGFETGVAVTPQNFPDHSAYDLTRAYNLATEMGRYAVFIFQWQNFDIDRAAYLVRRSRKMGLTPLIALSPTSLDQGRAALDLPDSIRRAAKSNISFGNPIIRRAYIDAVRDLASLRLPYLCLATEINFLVLKRRNEYLHFAELYKEAYRQVKNLSPKTRVFVSFQWELIRIIDAKEPYKINDHRKVIDIFRPELDVVGFTTYPSPHHYSPAQLPLDYYAWMHKHVKQYEEVVLMEVGWPSAGSGSEFEQHDFIRRLPKLLHQVNPSIVAWSLLHDVHLDQFNADLNSTGLITRHGHKKKAYRTFGMLQDWGRTD